eukprot:12565097-Ditylum_brightwellii.AAC.1
MVLKQGAQFLFALVEVDMLEKVSGPMGELLYVFLEGIWRWRWCWWRDLGGGNGASTCCIVKV